MRRFVQARNLSPIGSNMTEDEQDRVIEVLLHLFQTAEVKKWTASIR